MRLFISITFAAGLFAFSSFGADELQFEGKSMETWLNDLIGIPGTYGEPFPSEETKQQALKAFQRMGSREFDYLVEKLASTTSNKFSAGAITTAFKVAGTNATPEIPKLIALFNNGDETTIWVVARCLIGIGTNSVAPLMNALSNQKIEVRKASALCLGQIGPPAGPAVPLMLDRLKIEDVQVRMAIISSLGLIGQYPEKVIPVLTESLKSQNQTIRGNAAFSISCFGKIAESAAPTLFKLLNDNDGTVRNNAAAAIMRMNLGPEYLPLLISNATNNDTAVRCLIAQALGNQGDHTNEVFPVLLKLTEDPDRYVRESAGVTLNQMGYQPPVNLVPLRGQYYKPPTNSTNK